MNLNINDMDSLIDSVRRSINRCVEEMGHMGELLAKNALKLTDRDIAGVHGCIVAINSIQAEYFNWEQILWKLEREREAMQADTDWQPCECSGCEPAEPSILTPSEAEAKRVYDEEYERRATKVLGSNECCCPGTMGVRCNPGECNQNDDLW